MVVRLITFLQIGGGNMKLNYIILDVEFDSPESLEAVRLDFNVQPVNITEKYIEECQMKNQTYNGPKKYMFIGNTLDIINYLLYGYPVQDLEELKNCISDIRTINI